MAANNGNKKKHHLQQGGSGKFILSESLIGYKCKAKYFNQAGFTLVELIIGMVVLAIVMTIITGLLAQQAQQSASPIIQLRATELGQAMMNEILAKSFDDNSDKTPPWDRCDENAPACTLSDNFGPEGGETRSSFDDVDDYHNLNFTGAAIENSLGLSSDFYLGYTVEVAVFYDGNFDGTVDTNTQAKLITVTITASNNEVYGFSAYRGNY